MGLLANKKKNKASGTPVQATYSVKYNVADGQKEAAGLMIQQICDKLDYEELQLLHTVAINPIFKGRAFSELRKHLG